MSLTIPLSTRVKFLVSALPFVTDCSRSVWSSHPKRTSPRAVDLDKVYLCSRPGEHDRANSILAKLTLLSNDIRLRDL